MPTRDQSQNSNAVAPRAAFAGLLFIALLFPAPQSVPDARGLMHPCLARPRVQEQKPKPEPLEGHDSANPPSPQDRHSLPLPNALLGHWVSEVNKTHMYFTPDLYISVYSGKFYMGRYTLEEIDEQGRTVRMRIKPQHSRILTFSAEKDSFVDIAEVAGIKATEEQAVHWKFVDESQKPTPEVLQSTQGDETVVEAVTIEEAPKPEFIIGDSRTKLFYSRGCPEYETLPPRRRVYFKTKVDARKAGYHAAKNCP